MGETRQYTREEGGGLPLRYETVGSDLDVPIWVGGEAGRGTLKHASEGARVCIHRPPFPPSPCK